MKTKTIAKCALLGLALGAMSLQAQTNDTIVEKKSCLTIGGYGEAVYTRNFYSDNMFRYSHAERYKDAKGHGRIDLPHVVINLGYDFGKGWSMGSEIEFEHGGNEVAVEIEAEETGEFEHEIERGGEVAYDIMRPMNNKAEQQLFLFGRYDYYDSYIPTANALTDYQWTDRHVMTIGVNYYPIPQVVIKAEYAKRFLKEQYNDEPMFSLGVAYSGFFTK